MANTINECISLKDSDHKKLIYILSKFHLDENLHAACFNQSNGLENSTLKYKLVDAEEKPARDEIMTFMTPLYENYDHTNFPEGHQVTVELYDKDEETLIDSKSADTKDSPILR